MRNTLIVLFILLILWIAGSSYWYVCRIRCDCQSKSAHAAEAVAPGEIPGNITDSPDQQLQAMVEEAKTYLTGSGTQSVFFEFSSAVAETNTIPQEYIEKLKIYLENRPEAKVSVTGHTDSSGPRSVNVELSRKRAEFIRDCLIKSGINPSQIQTESKVDSEPAASNDTVTGRAKNRRTEIKILI